MTPFSICKKTTRKKARSPRWLIWNRTLLFTRSRAERKTMETQDIYLTSEGRQRHLERLEHLLFVKRPEIADYIHEAKESGDVTDNATYEDAKKRTGAHRSRDCAASAAAVICKRTEAGARGR
jgi:hypothetical protein